MSKNWLKDLNEKQYQAVSFGEGPLLILAGAGSGKTRALTYRAAYLIKEKQISPDRIMLTTFTNKAADEMKERVKKLVGKEFELPVAGTFHSFCARFLRVEGKYLGIPVNYTIYDDEDAIETVKQAMENLEISVKQYKPRSVKSVISGAKNELITALEYGQFARGSFQEMVAKIMVEYQRLLKLYEALDFDDLLLETVKLLKKEKTVLDKYRNQFMHVLVDEYQDTNKAQYELTKMLSSKWRNLFAVGDFSQCLPSETQIITKEGKKPINQIKVGDKVLSATGRGSSDFFGVTKVFKRKYSGKMIKITTKSGAIIKLTPNHIMFGKLVPSSLYYHIYLMYRKDFGYRIGVATGERTSKSIGIKLRGNQESADKMWIIKECKTKKEAIYWEFYYAFKYGIPTLVFYAAGRSMMITQGYINKLYKQIDTEKRALKLMKDLDIDPRYPHHRSQGTTSRRKPNRHVIHLKFFQELRPSLKSPWCAHRISLNTSDWNLEKKVKKAGFYTRPGRKSTWRTEIMRVEYKTAEKIAKQLSESAGDIEISYEAFLVKDKSKFLFQPASHIRRSMALPALIQKGIKPDRVVKIEQENYKGYVYDLEIDKTHNYLADRVVVHNSIYSFRGADFRNLKRLEADFGDLTVINLEQNYRSSQTILSAANQVIAKNKTHPILKLWTDAETGDRLKLLEVNDEKEEAAYIINEILKRKNYNQIAILYRTNAQSRVMEEALIKASVPYTLVGGVRFYSRKEIKDCLAYLRFLNNPKDKISYSRIEKLGKKRLNNFLEWKEKSDDKISQMTSLELLEKILQVTKYLDKFNKKDESDLVRLENIKELGSVAREFKSLKAFLENVALVEQTDAMVKASKAPRRAVTLMTLHASKGLEFKTVFMIGMEEGLFPHSRSMMDRHELEEERRLCYVGMTRAKESLWLSYARRRLYFGLRSSNATSRFLGDIEEDLVELVGLNFDDMMEADDY